MILTAFGGTNILIAVLFKALLTKSQYCKEEVYGQVNAYDCHAAIAQMPFALLPATSWESVRPRQFAEPQFQNPSFGAINNQFSPAAIVQFPKIWRYSKYHQAFSVMGERKY